MDKIELMKLFGTFSNPKMTEIGFYPFLVVLLISLLSAFFISFLYVYLSSSSKTGSKIHRSFPLLALSITAIFICIQFSLPLSLGLLGALSIVRFRTPVKEPEEIGFIMLVIASSISCATFNMLFLAIILIIAVIATIIMRYAKGILTGKVTGGMLLMKMPAAEYQEKNNGIIHVIEELLPKGRIDGITATDSETTISYSFSKMKIDTYLDIQKRLQAISEKAKINLFYNNPGEL